VLLQNGREMHLSASIGVAGCVPDHPQTTTVLFAEADKALYRAKAEGRGRMVLA
jgi:diguanylate cyclase (GGDEF)-like protein